MEFMTTEKHIAVLTKSFNNTEEFFFSGGIILLGSIEFARIECNGCVFLHNNRAQLIIRGICVYMERFVMIGITDEGILASRAFTA